MIPYAQIDIFQAVKAHRGVMLDRITNELPDAVVLIDPGGPGGAWVIVDCNPAFCATMGSERGALIGQPVGTLTHEAHGLTFDAHYLAHLRSAGHDRLELTTVGDRPPALLEAVLKLVTIDGRDYVLRVDRDITGRKRAELELRRRRAIDQCVSAINHRLLLAGGDMDLAVNDTLAQIGAFLDVDRVTLFQLGLDSAELRGSHEWRSAAIGGGTHGEPISPVRLPWLVERVRAERIIYCSDLDDLPPEAAAEAASMAERGVRALLAVPFALADQTTGLLSCEAVRGQRHWTNEDIALLLLAGESIGQALGRKLTAVTLEPSDARYKILTDHATDVISMHDIQGVFRYCSPVVQAILGYHPHELIGTSALELFHPEDLATALAKGKIHDSGAVTTNFRFRHKAGHYIWIETSARAVCDPDTGEVREVVAITRDIDERKQFEERIEHLAYYDPLTKLANRRRFQEQTSNALDQANRAGHRLALLYLDLDGFKKVNDTLGHDAGDELLIQVAARLRSQLGPLDTLARLGGDEFALLLPMIEEDADGALMAQRLLDQIALPLEIRGQTIHLGGSIGIASTPDNGSRFEDLLKHADIAMYRAKAEGRRYEFFDPSLSEHSRDRLQLEADLRRALRESQLVLHYQPVFNLQTGTMESCEALVRWNHPTRGVLMPGAFVPLAEESGLIRELDRWVFQSAMEQQVLWRAEGREVRIAVNVSARTLHDRRLIEFFRECLQHTGAVPTQVVVELTESVAMRDAEVTRRVLAELRAMGVRVAVDDFGVGHAALNYLKQLPIDFVKIDRSFTQGIGRDPRDEGVVRAVVALSEGMGVEVIAEGVTDGGQAQWLQTIGCRMVQGYGVGKPQPPEQLFELTLAVGLGPIGPARGGQRTRRPAGRGRRRT